MENHLLSKSTFQRGIQCVKSLYLYKNFIHLRDSISTEQKAVFNRGNYVGVYAHRLFPGGVDVSKVISGGIKKNNRYQAMVEKTKELLDAGEEILYEAAFQQEGVLVIVDILAKKEGRWYAYEVKSSTRITQTYITDASLQYWVIKKTDLLLADFSLVIINNQYIRRGDVDVHGLFIIKSIVTEAERNQDQITEHIKNLKRLLIEGDMPKTEIGERCFSPYNCDFMGLCWKNVPKNSIFELSGVGKADLFELYKAGVKTIQEIPDENTLNKNVNIHIKAHKEAKVLIDVEGIDKFIENIKYPLYFIDFEIFMPAIPIYENTKPYQHIPFQYSIHYKASKDSKPEHLYFLAEAGCDPRKRFLEQFLKDTEKPGTILVYDTLMEASVLHALKKELADYEADILSRINRFVDLMKPFQDRLYYHPAMNNSCSIKNVLHALVPELTYSDLNIQSGSMAMAAFEQLQAETDILKIIETRDNLLKYCELDTLAMVKVFSILEHNITSEA
jgi:hypothetical protein